MRTTFSRRESFQAVLPALLVPLFGWPQGPRPRQQDTDGNENSAGTSPRGATLLHARTTYLYDDDGQLLSVIRPEPGDGTLWILLTHKTLGRWRETDSGCNHPAARVLRATVVVMLHMMRSRAAAARYRIAHHAERGVYGRLTFPAR